MNRFSKIIIVLLRISLGWIFVYDGLSKILDPRFSAKDALDSAKVLPAYYHYLASPGHIAWTNIALSWGPIILGTLLIVGLFVRYASSIGIVFSLTTYFSLLAFPVVLPSSYVIDEHIIYILLLILFTAINAGTYFGLDRYIFTRRDY